MGTAVTLAVLQQYLEDFGWTKFTAVDEPYEREGLIFTGYIDEQHRRHEIVIDPIVEKGVLRIFAPRVVMAPREKTPQDRLFELLLALGTLNTVSVLASFAYDPSDGEVKIAVAMPIEENDISFEQFKRALVNLIDNAAEAMSESPVRELLVETRAAPGETVEVEIADTGCGITTEDKEKLFLPYFSTKKRGTGLGLAIVSHIVAEHHAQIRVEDNTPAGARFIIELPAAPVPDGSERAAEARP